MATQPLQIDIKGAVEVLRTLERLKHVAMSMRPALQTVGAYMLEVVKDAFVKGQSPATGAAWAPLAQSTLESEYLGRVRSSYSGGAPLRRTGQLMNSISVLDLDSESVSVGSTLPYALPHNVPPESSKRHFPQREFLAFRRNSADEIAGIFANYLKRQAGF